MTALGQSKRRYSADDIMLNMGFPPDATGPYVTELREHIREQVAAGMINRSGGSWDTGRGFRQGSSKPSVKGPDGLMHQPQSREVFENNPDIWNQHELRARCLLEVDWSIGLGHSHRVELLDTAPIMRTMRWFWEFHPKLIRPWIADHLRVLAYSYRIWRDRNLKNPYSNRSGE